MKNLTLDTLKRLLRAAVLIAALGFCVSAQAANEAEHRRQIFNDDSLSLASSSDVNQALMASQQGFGNSIATPSQRQRTPRDLVQWLADNDGNFRSKSEVVKEVKKRYDARVLKITLDERRAVYRVRILMPGGKVRNITLSAKS